MSINTDGAELYQQKIRELEKALEVGEYSLIKEFKIFDHISDIKPASINEILANLIKQYGKEQVAVALDEELQKL